MVKNKNKRIFMFLENKEWVCRVFKMEFLELRRESFFLEG